MSKPHVLRAPKSLIDSAIVGELVFGVGGGPFFVLFTATCTAIAEQRPFLPLMFGLLKGGLYMGLYFGICGAVMCGWAFRTNLYSVEVVNRDSFSERLGFTMKKIRYVLVEADNEYFVYKPTFRAGIAVPRIHVQLSGNRAFIVSPIRHAKT